VTAALLLALAAGAWAQSPMPYSGEPKPAPAPAPAASTATVVAASTVTVVDTSTGGVHVGTGSPQAKLSRPIRAVLHPEAKTWEPLSLRAGGDPGQAETKAVLLIEKIHGRYKGTASKAKAIARLRRRKDDVWLIYSVFPKALERRRAHFEIRLRLVEGFVENVEASLVTVVDRHPGVGAGLDSDGLRAQGVEFEEDSPASGAILISALDPRPSKKAYNAGTLKQGAFADKNAGLADVSWAVTGLSGLPEPVVFKPSAPVRARAEESSGDSEAPRSMGGAELLAKAAKADQAGDYPKAAELYRKACGKRMPAACTDLAAMYAQGQGVPKDLSKAAEYHGKACKLGDGAGCNVLGSMLEQGEGVTQDYAKASESYDQACMDGVAAACSNLGAMLDAGRGMDQDFGKAMQLYGKACDAGDGAGCYNAGAMYDGGRGVDQDFAKAVQLYGKACDAGNGHACSNLGGMYTAGHGVGKGYGRAFKFYSQACDLKYGDACYNAGVMSDKGMGLIMDPAKAKEFFAKACQLGTKLGCDAKK
jgi:TPR repeat protein